jgi:predicted secreted Zn-dependent protease
MDPVATRSAVVRTTSAPMASWSCETVECRRRRVVSTVVAHFDRVEQSSDCVNASSVDERIAIG